MSYPQLHATRAAVGAAAVVLAIALAACGDGTGPSPLANAYVLSTVAGEPVPYEAGRFGTPPTNGTVYQLSARTVEFLDGSRAQYATEDRSILYENGIPRDTLRGCESRTVQYRRDGARVILFTERSGSGAPSGGFPTGPAPFTDTLTVRGDALVATERVRSDRPAAELVYVPGRPQRPIC